MAEFKSWRSFWEFEHAVKRQMRYVRTTDTEAFLEAVGQTAGRRIEVLPVGTTLWRAQLGVNWRPDYDKDGDLVGETPWPHDKDRMKPLRDCATEGRANSKGIPCLYLATDRDTAIAEVRPWIGSYVSVGLFRTDRELRVVKCVTDYGLRRYWIKGEPDATEREEAVWAFIDAAFAHPVTPIDNVADYAPTQIIAELFKAHGYDGIAYRSSVSKTGHNVALFDLDASEVVEGQPFEVKTVELQSRAMENPAQYR